MTEPIHTAREIEQLIPHRWPFLLVDRIDEYDPEARRIVGVKAVTATEWYFQGHFPGLPVMPGVLQVEALAQTMAVYVAKQEGFGDRIGLFAGRRRVPLQARRQARRRPPPGGHDGEARPPFRARQGGRQRGRRGLLRSVALLHHPRRVGAALMTRIALFSDVHGVVQALEAVRAAIAAAAPDVIAVAGDLAMNGGDPAATVDGIRELEAAGALVIAGNTDIAVADFDYGAAFPWFDDAVPESMKAAAEWAHEALGPERVDWLRRLPAERRVRAADGTLVLVTHASPGSQTAGFDRGLDESVFIDRLGRTDARIICCGHTHVPEVRDFGWKVVVNGGSAGYVFDGDPTASWALIDVVDGNVAAEVKRATFDALAASDAVSNRGLPGDVYRAATIRTGKLVR